MFCLQCNAKSRAETTGSKRGSKRVETTGSKIIEERKFPFLLHSQPQVLYS